MKQLFWLLGALTLALAGNAFAQDKFPSRPITLICPWSAGGGTDIHLRKLAQLQWYKSSDDYKRWAAETLAVERVTIERVGLLVK
jgi:hypothetical protein